MYTLLMKLLDEMIIIKGIKHPYYHYGKTEYEFMYRFVRTSNFTANKSISNIRRFAENLGLPAYVVARLILYGEKFPDIFIR